MLTVDSQTIQAVTFGTALLGAALGIINAWRAWSGDRVKLRVRVSHAFGVHGGHGMSIEIVNLSTFPLTITMVGFDLTGTTKHVQISQPLCTRDEQLPVRLEARTALTVLQPLAAFQQEQLLLLDRAYVRTACGLTSKSSRRFFRNLHQLALAGQC